MTAVTTGDKNVAVGYDALTVNTTGHSNTALGYQAGDVIITGTNNVCIGSGSDPNANNGTNQIVIGYGATGTGNNYAVIGNADITRVYAAQDGGATVYCGRVIETMSATGVTAQNHTVTAANINSGILIHTTTTGPGVLTTDTATNIISTCGLDTDGDCATMYYINDGTQLATFAAGTGVTIGFCCQYIASKKTAKFIFRRTGGSAVTLYIVE